MRAIACVPDRAGRRRRSTSIAEIPRTVDGCRSTCRRHRRSRWPAGSTSRAAARRGADAERQVSYARNQLLPQVDVNLALTRRETADTFASSFGLDGFKFATFFTISMPVDRTPQIVDTRTRSSIAIGAAARSLTLQRRIADDVKQAVRERDRADAIAGRRPRPASRSAAGSGSGSAALRDAAVEQSRCRHGREQPADGRGPANSSAGRFGRRQLSLRAMLGILDPRTDTRARPPHTRSTRTVP